MGVFSDFKLIKTRSVCQLIIEVPLEQADKCLAAMGGVPLPGQERPVAVARLMDPEDQNRSFSQDHENDLAPVQLLGNSEQLPQKDEPKQWKDLRPSQQAGILCSDLEFQKWIAGHAKWGPVITRPDNSYGEDHVTDLVRRKCGVRSRSELDLNVKASGTWEQIVGDFRWHQSHGGQS
ncbi:MAG: hypothetical protein M3O22_04995 [Pseudomonadota bacterium]|nr:hypothetical protein [Pseudomonadota bacterium]